MKSLLFPLLLALTMPVWAGEAASVGEDPLIEQRMVKLSEDLRCLVCQNESRPEDRGRTAGMSSPPVRGI
jgi:cytochrome c-type biogenesis protein CcmH